MKKWKEVVGYEGLYRVSQEGKIFSEYSKRLLTPYPQKDGYLRVNLYKDKKVKIIMLHRIVAEAFIPNPDNLPVVNHIDGNKANPKMSNLEWVTFSENSLHAFLTGLSHISDKCRKAASLIAAENGRKTTSKPIVQMNIDGHDIQKYASLREASRHTGISRANILRACRSSDFSAGGYRWKR